MQDTPPSLLQNLQGDPSPDDWARFLNLYQPFLRGVFARCGIQPDDVDDLIQEVIQAWFKSAKTFRHNGERGAFRKWLRVTAINRFRKLVRANKRWPRQAELVQFFDQLEDPRSQGSQYWDERHEPEILRSALKGLRSEYEGKKTNTWRAFEMLCIEGHGSAAVAKTLGMSLGAVYVAKSRMLACLRQAIGGMLDD